MGAMPKATEAKVDAMFCLLCIFSGLFPHAPSHTITFLDQVLDAMSISFGIFLGLSAIMNQIESLRDNAYRNLEGKR